MVRCRYQREDVLGGRLGRGSRRPALRQVLSGSNFGRCAELLLLQGHARMILAQCRPLLALRRRGRPAHIRHRWHPRVHEGQHAKARHTQCPRLPASSTASRATSSDQRFAAQAKFKSSGWHFRLWNPCFIFHRNENVDCLVDRLLDANDRSGPVDWFGDQLKGISHRLTRSYGTRSHTATTPIAYPPTLLVLLISGPRF